MDERRIYSLYGLKVGSAIPLPCPASDASGDEADVELVECTQEELGGRPEPHMVHFERDDFWECRRFEDGAARVSWKEHFEFRVSADGCEVRWRRLVGVPDEVLFTYLLNQALAQCLALRGVEPLHATSVVVRGRAIAIMGDSGFGKSTLAAALIRRGCPLLTDDVLVLEMLGESVQAYPSLPRLKLHPDSADFAFEGRRSLPMNTFTNKMILPLGRLEHVSLPFPLAAIYVIPSGEGAEAIAIQRVRGQRTLLPIIQNSFETSFLDRRRLERQFEFAGRLANTVPISELSFPRRLDALPSVADALLADASRYGDLQ